MSVRYWGAAVLGLRSALGVSWGFVLVPDTDAYLGRLGGHWFYPSPGGRAVGYFGFDNLAAFSVVAAALLGYFVVRLSQEHGNTGWAAVIFITITPLGWYLQPIGLDAAGALCVVLACIYGRTWGGWAASLAAVLLHPASILGYLGWRAWRGGLAAVLAVSTIALCGAAAALMTPYAGVFSEHGWSSLRAVVFTFGLAFAIPTLGLVVGVLRFRRGAPLTLAGWSAASVVLILIAQGGVQLRYLLPTFCLLAAAAYRPSRPAVVS